MRTHTHTPSLFLLSGVAALLSKAPRSPSWKTQSFQAKPCQKTPTDPPGPDRVRRVAFGAGSSTSELSGNCWEGILGGKKARSRAKRLFFWDEKSLFEVGRNHPGAALCNSGSALPVFLYIQHFPSFAAFICPSK